MSFKRPESAPVSKVEDNAGRIRIYVARADAGTKGKANITRAIYVDDATVTDVANAIDRALFGEPTPKGKK